MSNYEKIKNMSIDEMADFLEDIYGVDCNCPAKASCDMFDSCLQAIVAWLESEVKE